MIRRSLGLLLVLLLTGSVAAQPPLPSDGALYVGTSERGRMLLASLHLFPPDGAELQLLEAPAGPGEEASVELTLTGPYIEHQRELEVVTETWTFIAGLLPDGGLDSQGAGQLYLYDLEPIEFRAVGSVLLGGLRLADGSFAVQRWAPFFYADPWSEIPFDLAVDEFVAEGLLQRRELPRTPAGIYTDSRTVYLAGFDTDLVSYYIVIDTYTGGAHPNSRRESRTLLRVDGGWEAAGGICEVPKRLGWTCDEATIRRSVIAGLRRQGASWVVQGEVTEETEWLLDSFVISPWSVRVLFDPYAVGPYVQGPYEVDVPLEELGR
ncbi:MAG TPA: DUF3298 domain-containing protein [Trueperaceae bacterium]